MCALTISLFAGIEPAGAQATWIPTASGPPILAQAAVLDVGRGRLVVTGGVDVFVPLDQTREYAGGWSAGPRLPSALFYHAIAYDPLRRRVVLAGGFDDVGDAMEDVWEYDGTGWVAAPALPAPRTRHGMAYHPDLGGIVLFGGTTGGAPDTLIFDGTSWRAGPASPTGLVPRSELGIAYDAIRRRIVVFGGQGATDLDDTWELDAAGWTAGPTAPPGLTPRYAVAMAHDTWRARTMLVGGISSGSPRSDVWEYDGTAWTPGPPAPPLMGARQSHVMGHGTRIVLSGGGDFVNPPPDTWEFGCPIDVSPTVLPNAIVGVPYGVSLVASGGSPPYTFSVAAGGLPPGLQLSASGAITGTPAVSGTFVVDVRATDASGCPSGRHYLLSVIGACPTLVLAPASLPRGTSSASYSQTISASGGTPPYTFAVVSGMLPPGLSLDTAGRLAGTPAASGSFGLVVGAWDAAGCDGSRSYVLAVDARDDYVVGKGLGLPNDARVRLFSETGVPDSVAFDAYGSGRFGVRVAAGPVTGLAEDRLVTGPGPGPGFGPHARAFRRDGTPLAGLSFYAYATLRHGLGVAVSDVDGVGYGEIVTGPGPGSVFGPHVRGFGSDGAPVVVLPGCSFYAYATPRFGVEVSGGAIDTSPRTAILTAPGPGPTFGPQIRGWRYGGASVTPITRVNFEAFTARQYGATVSAGDADGDGLAEIVAAPGPGGTLPCSFRGYDEDGAGVRPLPGYDVTPFASAYGGRPSMGDMARTVADDLITSAGPDPSAATTVRSHHYNGAWLSPVPGSFDAFPGGAFGPTTSAGLLGL